MMYFDGFFFGNGKNPEKNALIKKGWTGLKVFYDLTELYMGRFVYKMPETCDPFFFELCMLYSGEAMIIKKDGEIMNLRPIEAGRFDKYGYPEVYSLMDYVGRNYGRYIPDSPGNAGIAEGVLCKNRKNPVPAIYKLIWYADRITELQTSISASISNLRGTTIVVCGSKEQEAAVKRAYKNAGNGIPVIFAFGNSEGAFSQPPQIITNAQTGDILKTLQENYDKTVSQFCADFGINAAAVVNKLSGVSGEELKQNDEMININMMNDYNTRKDAMRRAADFFGVEFDVSINKPDTERKGGEEDVI